jgi:methylamine dehydrogenase heavy chain
MFFCTVLACISSGSNASSQILSDAYPEPLSAEELGVTRLLPEPIPSDWVFVQYLVAPSTIDNKIELFDLNGRAPDFTRGQIPAAYYPSFLQSSVRPELYVAETFFSRGSRGERTDVVTVYDSVTLESREEITLPAGKRGLMVSQPNTFRFTDNEKFGLVYNFTPASSVTVVDILARTVSGEIEIPGCALIYPTGERGFSSLCGNGTMISIQFDKDGGVVSEFVTEPFNDLDDDPLFSAPGVVGYQNYFVSYLGNLQPVDLSGSKPVIGEKWSLVSDEEVKAGWRPSASYPVMASSRHLYVLMRPDGFDGSHRHDGKEVWVFDIQRQEKIATIELTRGGQGLAMSNEATPRLLVATGSKTLDVYDPSSGAELASFDLQAWGPALLFPAGTGR